MFMFMIIYLSFPNIPDSSYYKIDPIYIINLASAISQLWDRGSFPCTYPTVKLPSMQEEPLNTVNYEDQDQFYICYCVYNEVEEAECIPELICCLFPATPSMPYHGLILLIPDIFNLSSIIPYQFRVLFDLAQGGVDQDEDEEDALLKQLGLDNEEALNKDYQTRSDEYEVYTYESPLIENVREGNISFNFLIEGKKFCLSGIKIGRKLILTNFYYEDYYEVDVDGFYDTDEDDCSDDDEVYVRV
ncbi:MAG: hypothetical protein EZS28_038229 [Streblomastix strix]|uniref:Uncharacterized protein n=1 Tax=Streblomastix strix TaxID=222440 RepID=A0A5J4U7K2_9EUKA|nr:MAG: hypothetical protein EZS28_038229 [Streblomastix strix]